MRYMAFLSAEAQRRQKFGIRRMQCYGRVLRQHLLSTPLYRESEQIIPFQEQVITLKQVWNLEHKKM